MMNHLRSFVGPYARIFCILSVLFLVMAACGSPPAPQQVQGSRNLTFTDATGTRITLPTTPQRISCLTGICVDILAELGIEPVSVTGTLQEDPRYFGKKFPAIGGGFGEENLEDIAKSRPDLVIGLGGVHEKLREGLKDIAPLYIMGPTNYNDSINLLKEMGYLTGHEKQAEIAAQRFIDKLNMYKAKSPKNKSALIMYGASADFGIETNIALVGSMLSEVTNYPWPSANPDAPAHTRGIEPYSLEKVLKVDPDVIFVESFTFGASQPVSAQLAANPIWGELKAVKNKQVYEMNTEIWATGRGTRTFSIILDEAMAKLYPGVFNK